MEHNRPLATKIAETLIREGMALEEALEIGREVEEKRTRKSPDPEEADAASNGRIPSEVYTSAADPRCRLPMTATVVRRPDSSGLDVRIVRTGRSETMSETPRQLSLGDGLEDTTEDPRPALSSLRSFPRTLGDVTREELAALAERFGLRLIAPESASKADEDPEATETAPEPARRRTARVRDPWARLSKALGHYPDPAPVDLLSKLSTKLGIPLPKAIEVLRGWNRISYRDGDLSFRVIPGDYALAKALENGNRSADDLVRATGLSRSTVLAFLRRRKAAA